jgi:hypothetical protein
MISFPNAFTADPLRRFTRARRGVIGLSWLLVVAPFALLADPASPYRGLWAGEVKLNYATEVSVPLDENNVPIAPNPTTPTPTFDQANLRLILHVSSSGKVSLVKDVAILNRNGSTNLVKADSDIALVTDERLYADFPPQPAIRVASAAFDFGDSKATEAVQAIIDAAVNAVSNSISSTQNISALTQIGKAAGDAVVYASDTTASFQTLLATTNFNAAAIDKLVGNTNLAQNSLLAATNYRNQSLFFADTRGIEMIQAVLGAISSASTPVLKTNEAQNTAASFADFADDYHRFIAGKQFGDMITAAAQAASRAATNAGANSNSISLAVNTNSAVSGARLEALRLKVTLYRDSRGSNAIEQVVAAIVTNAFAMRSNSLATIQQSAEQVGRDVLATRVARYPVAFQPPTSNYNAFIASALFRTNTATAAKAAATAAVLERQSNILYTPDSIARKARAASIDAMENVLSEAALAVRTELPLAGTFGRGQGDPRLTFVIRQTNVTATLGPPALSGTVVLPANHPTNPFRHRRHPDHTVGFDITRNIRLDFEPAVAGALMRAGVGVDRITGTYREEIFGLHKPLGPQKDTGLRVEGSFELNRISLVDTLNAR